MRTSKVYIETSVFNFAFADDAPEKKHDTLILFNEIKEGKYEPYTSEYVLRELRRASEPKQAQMIALISECNMIYLDASTETEKLADIYVTEGIIPPKYSTDGLHIASASVNDLDFIVSWNFKHIVKRKTVTMSEAINLREGYKRIGIFSPTEVIENDE